MTARRHVVVPIALPALLAILQQTCRGQLPGDARVRGGHYAIEEDAFLLLVESDTFKALADSEAAPRVELILRGAEYWPVRHE